MESDSLHNNYINSAYKIIGCDLQRYFKGTCEYNQNNKTNLILDVEIKEQKFHQRIFYKNDKKEVGYIEVIQNFILSYTHEQSKNISFLFGCDSKDNQKIDNNKCFGFRYYDGNNKYCTLLKANRGTEDDYFFLEKLNDKDNEFFNKNLDCFKIIFYSIFSRYKKDKNGDNLDFQLIKERPFYEILGFNYSILLKSNNIFKFHKIHSINLLTDNDFTSHTVKENDKTKLNIMPILFDGHISLLFFFEENNERNFILSDPSHKHAKMKRNSITINPFLFSENMRKHLTIFPNCKIQAFNSCSLWYYFQILCLLNYNAQIQNKKYIDAKSLINSLKDSSFYLDCFEYYQYIMGFEKKLIEINPIETFNDDDYFYYIRKNFNFGVNIKINKLCFLNQFIDLFEFIELYTGQSIIKSGLHELNLFREYNEELIDFIIYLNYNIGLLELKSKKDIEVINSLRNKFNVLNDIRNMFINFCDEFLSGIIQINNNSKNLEDYNSKKYKNSTFNGKYLYQYTNEIKELIENFRDRKNEIEEIYNLYPLNTIGKILFPILGILYNS